MSVNLICAAARTIGGRQYRNYTSSCLPLLPISGHHRIRKFHLGMASANQDSTLKSGGTPGKLSQKQIKSMTNEEWAKKLTAEEYYVTREQGTEAPFTGKYYNYSQEGVYSCVCCDVELFSSKSKFDSGCGWPSFSEELKQAEADGIETGVLRRSDFSAGMERTECICKNCNAHLGHVFDDGPTETRERYCINSAALKFHPKKM